MQSTAGSHEHADETELVSPERLIYFSDAVVAIAITLPALELPVLAGTSTATPLWCISCAST